MAHPRKHVYTHAYKSAHMPLHMFAHMPTLMSTHMFIYGRQAPEPIQHALHDHDAIVYRSAGDDGAAKHEFAAAMRELRRRLLS